MSADALPGPWAWGRGGRSRGDRGIDLGEAARLMMMASRRHEHQHEHRHGRGRRGGFPGPGFGSFAGPFPGPFPGGPGFGRGPKVARGDVRNAILALLADEPMHGYQIIRELTERSGGAWRPSPGSVYPVLQLLADEGLVRAEETGGKRIFHLTDAGRVDVESRAGEPKPWDLAADADTVTDLRSVAFQVGAAVVQVARTGSEAQVEAARKVLVDAKRALYRILADDEMDGTDEPDATGRGTEPGA